MPRRNHPQRNRRGHPYPLAPEVEPDAIYDETARHLVATGQASPLILGGFRRPTTPRTTNERNHP